MGINTTCFLGNINNSLKLWKLYLFLKFPIIHLHPIMRQTIINKAAEMFLTLGFKSVTMDDIANELAISKKTIYVNFVNKTKLVEAVTFEILESISCDIDRVYNTSPNPIQELYDFKIFIIQYLKADKASPQFQLKKYYPQVYHRLHLKQFEKMHNSVKTSLRKGMSSGLFRDNIDVDFISRMYFNGMTGINADTFFPREIYNMENLMERFLEYHLRAIVTEKGLQELNKFIKSNQS